MSNATSHTVKRACVIGAGTAGLCAIKHSVEKGFDVMCYEQSNQLGGTWIYNDNIQNVKYEDEIQSSMYDGLRTNLPKEVMGYPDFPYPQDTEVSFISSDKVLSFLKYYAAHFHLEDFIRYQHEVIRVRPRSCIKEDDKLWEVLTKDRITGEFKIDFFDFVLVCNGHFSTPEYPVIENMKNYKGHQMHSHLYRKTNGFEGETVLVIGAGPSGIDIAHQLSRVAKKVFLSHHTKPLPIVASIVQKPDVKRFTENGAEFKDGSIEIFSRVVYCTGYKYKFPFLSIDCGIHNENNCVQPLYKHILNINNPSMAFIGLPFKVCPTQLFDLQTRFALKYFTNEKELPTREDMLMDLEHEIQNRLESGLPIRRLHEMASRQYKYYEDLAATADIEPLKPVISTIMKECYYRFINELDTYRNYGFKVLDDSNFEKFKVTA